jgi:hypothetical protein
MSNYQVTNTYTFAGIEEVEPKSRKYLKRSGMKAGYGSLKPSVPARK